MSITTAPLPPPTPDHVKDFWGAILIQGVLFSLLLAYAVFR